MRVPSYTHGITREALAAFLAWYQPKALQEAANLRRRWKVPSTVTVEDVAQELLAGVVQAATEYDPARGMTWKNFVLWQATYHAKRWIHRQRGAARLSGKSHSRNYAHADVDDLPLANPAGQEVVAELHSRVARAQRGPAGPLVLRALLANDLHPGHAAEALLSSPEYCALERRPEDRAFAAARGVLAVLKQEAELPMVKASNAAGVNLAEVNEDVLNKALQAAGLDTGGQLGPKVKRLADHLKTTVPKGELADCTTCGGVSSVKSACCPYCGDGELEGEAAKVVQGGQQAPAPPAPTPTPTSPVRVAQEAPTSPAVRRQLLPNVPPPAPPVVIPTTATVVTENGQALVEVTGEQKLDRLVQRIQMLKAAAAASCWELGTQLKEAYTSGLWRERRTLHGSQRYKAWGDFTEVELGISQGYAHKLMHVANEFTEEQIRKLGAGKLYIMLQVPRESREQLLGMAEDGASRRELDAAARGIGKRPVEALPGAEEETVELPDDLPGDEEPAPEGTPRNKRGGNRPAAGRPAAKITVSALLKRVEIPLTRGTSGKAAKAISDDPQGTERMINGVVQTYFLTKNDDGQLVLVVERRREKV